MNKSIKFLLVLMCILLTIGFKAVVGTTAEACVYNAATYQELKLSQLRQSLEYTGLVGRIHGADTSNQLFVLSVNDPKNFFNHLEFSLIPNNEKVRKTLTQVNRHDQVCIQGHLLENPSPQNHIAVKSISIQDTWVGLASYPLYQRQVKLPDELKNKTSFIGKVHAIIAAGKILVVDYKDGVIPIFVETPKVTEDLYRGDIVRIQYRIQSRPQKPTHLRLDMEKKQPIQVLDAISAWHEQEKTLSGTLVKFPKSPQIKFDVYAIEVETQGIKRLFTLINFEDAAIFQEIRSKLATIWETHSKTIIPGRNMLVNPKVILKAKGRINIISTEQANPQILLDSPEDLQMVFSS